jgi:isoquinoline 1-oxidoreductase alpha subunit
MPSYNLQINKKNYLVEADSRMPLLWVIRELVGLTGTKYGCGIAQCGACTVHLNGTPIRSCSLPVSAVDNKSVTTIEGLSPDNSHPVQKAWIAEQVPQCGYCQSGQIMGAAALLKKNPNPTDEDINTAMQGHICRCGTYTRIRKAIKLAAGSTLKTGFQDEQ